MCWAAAGQPGLSRALGSPRQASRFAHQPGDGPEGLEAVDAAQLLGQLLLYELGLLLLSTRNGSQHTARQGTSRARSCRGRRMRTAGGRCARQARLQAGHVQAVRREKGGPGAVLQHRVAQGGQLWGEGERAARVSTGRRRACGSCHQSASERTTLLMFQTSSFMAPPCSGDERTMGGWQYWRQAAGGGGRRRDRQAAPMRALSPGSRAVCGVGNTHRACRKQDLRAWRAGPTQCAQPPSPLRPLLPPDDGCDLQMPGSNVATRSGLLMSCKPPAEHAPPAAALAPTNQPTNHLPTAPPTCRADG